MCQYLSSFRTFPEAKEKKGKECALHIAGEAVAPPWVKADDSQGNPCSLLEDGLGPAE